MKPTLDELIGGDRRSIGRANEVADQVIAILASAPDCTTLCL